MSGPRFSLTQVIDTIPPLPPSLMSDRARRSLRWISDQLPAGVSNRYYFECRLADNPQVDIVVCLDERNRDLLLENEAHILPSHLRAHSIWASVLGMLTAWRTADSPLGRAINQIWLEFDAPSEQSSQPGVAIPCVFLAFPKGVPPAQIGDVTLLGLASLRRHPFDRATSQAVARAIDCLPKPARVAYSGLMCSRDLQTVRLCISNLRHDAIFQYLSDIGWPGCPAALTREIGAVQCPSVPDPLGSVALLHVDVGEHTAPRLGMEICFDRECQLRARTREQDLLDRLCRFGLCTPGKREALLQWPGSSVERFAHEVWPSIVVRRINGIKLVHIPERSLEAKVYLTAFHQVRLPHSAAGH